LRADDSDEHEMTLQGLPVGRCEVRKPTECVAEARDHDEEGRLGSASNHRIWDINIVSRIVAAMEVMEELQKDCQN